MDLNRAITAGDAVRRARAIAEFEEWEFAVHFHAKRTAEIDRTDEILLSKDLARRAVTLDIAQALHVSEQHVWALVHEASTLRDRAPLVWESFREGDIDAVRVSAIASTAEKLQTSEALSVLERSAPDYAASHTIAELRAWLRRFRARLEPEQVSAEAARATEERRVSITHNDDGTSWLNALLPTGVAIVIGDRLGRAARAVPAVEAETGEKERRTRDQKQADQLVEWLTSCLDLAPDMGIRSRTSSASLAARASPSTASPWRPHGFVSSPSPSTRSSADWSSTRSVRFSTPRSWPTGHRNHSGRH
ncbi:DUF222 domain-containing protein [Aeromicrobium sp. Marseille-Q0843]|uniref:DUF222 domain-containing protein n=1 Tax=Aeromicrobium phoceense TaxID=2754045 RepID=A0A838XED1_9ACTN|nr:DUF222 domain-containing protein [Aeromicrobium phoceense]MBA4608905.1 DUF222 domain-containing protein [Aeromicrobium phoceense]